jgi:hypothetical protein
MREMMATVSHASDPAVLKKIVRDFQAEIFSFFSWNRSATAYFRLQAEFYEALTGAVVRIARQKAGPADMFNQPLALVALGEGGIDEFSIEGRLQLLLIHDKTMPPERAALLGEAVHGTFLECGLVPDDVVTPRHAAWRFTKRELLERLISSTGNDGNEHAKELPELVRTVDQRLLYHENDLGSGLREECLKLISDSRSAVLVVIAASMP